MSLTLFKFEFKFFIMLSYHTWLMDTEKHQTRNTKQHRKGRKFRKITIFHPFVKGISSIDLTPTHKCLFWKFFLFLRFYTLLRITFQFNALIYLGWCVTEIKSYMMCKKLIHANLVKLVCYFNFWICMVERV